MAEDGNAVGSDDGGGNPQPASDADLAQLFRLRRSIFDLESARRVQPGPLTARQRVEVLLDADSFLEIGALATSQQPVARASTPGDGVITGFGTVSGRQLAIISEDGVVLGRTDGQVSNAKRRRLLKLALAERRPVVFLADGPSGDPPPFPPDTGELFGHLADQRDEANLSARESLLISVVLGPTTGKTRELVLASDVVVAIAGGPGVDADVVTDNDEAALSIAARLMRLCRPDDAVPAVPPIDLVPGPDPPVFPDEAVESGELTRRLADPGSLIELSAPPGSGFIASLMAVGGLPLAVGVSGAFGQRVLQAPDIFRLERLVMIARRLDVPLLLVQDCEGYAAELMDDRHAAAAVGAVVAELRQARIPLLCLVVGSGHVLGTFCLGGRQLEPVYVAAWPWARVGVTDTASYEVTALAPQLQPDPWLAAGLGLIDDVLTPGETGPWLKWLVSLVSRRQVLPPVVAGNRWHWRGSPRGL